MTSSAGAWERFLPRGGPTNTKNEIFVFFLFFGSRFSPSIICVKTKKEEIIGDHSTSSPDEFSNENSQSINSKSALKEADAAFTSHFRQLGHQ